MKRVLALLGLSEGGSEDDVLIAINSLLTSSTAIAAAAGLTKDAKSEEIVAKVSAMRSTATPDPTKFVPIAQVEAMQTNITNLQKQLQDDKAEEAVDKAIASGKLAPAMRDWGLEHHRANPASFDAFVSKSPVLTSAQRTSAVPPKTDGPLAGLDDADIAVMRQMGLTAEDMKKSKAQMEEAV